MNENGRDVTEFSTGRDGVRNSSKNNRRVALMTAQLLYGVSKRRRRR